MQSGVVRHLARHRESLTAGILGFLFFAVTVGIEKLDPRNIAWMTFKDQRAHWVGWLFFADDRWRWPLGVNPRYGWGGVNSIVYTDSWPLFALLFKAIDLEIFDRGQYFGLALASCAIALFVGAEKLFRLLGLSHLQSLIGSIVLTTTPLFWWTQRWYSAISGGLCLLVWAFVYCLRTRRESRFRMLPWLVILLLAIATNFYLFGIVAPLWLAAVLSPGIRSRSDFGRLASSLVVTGLASALVMYVLGYFAMPVSSSSTGRYGIYTANLLGLFDVNSSSRLLPELPSPPLQYEPTSLGIGALLILAVAMVRLFVSPRQVVTVLVPAVRRHAWLTTSVLAMFAFAVSNYMTIGERGYNFEIHYRVWQLFSVFQSSVRFIWPLTALATIALVVISTRLKLIGMTLLVSACLLQVFDVWPQFRTVAERQDGTDSPIQYEYALWSALPSQYTTLAIHWPENIRTGWDECGYAAAMTAREARCGYLSRASGLEAIGAQQELKLLNGDPDQSVVYWLNQGWVLDHAATLRMLYGNGRHAFLLPADDTIANTEFVYFFPDCDSADDCAFLGRRPNALDDVLNRLARG